MDKAGLRRSWVDLEQPQAFKVLRSTLQKFLPAQFFQNKRVPGGVVGWRALSVRKIKGVILRHLKFSLNLYVGNICGVGKSPYLCTPQSKGKRVFIEG